MIKTIFTIFITICVLQTSAQFTIIARSPSFEEPETGFAKILFLKNGNTAFLHITKSDGIKVKLFDASHKQFVTRVVNHKFGKLVGLNVSDCFEANGNITLLLSEFEQRTPQLYRIVINGQTAAIESQVEIGELEKITLGKAYAGAFGGIAAPHFITRSDPYSENYAVVLYNTFASERDRRVELTHYNNKHEIISKSFLSTPENKYKYVKILDIALLGDKEAYALLYGFNTRSSGGKEGELFVASFKNSAETIDYISIRLDDSEVETDGILKYDKLENKLHAVVQSISSKTKRGFFSFDNNIYYELNSYIVEINAKKAIATPGIDLGKVNSKYKELFGAKRNYSGILQDYYLNTDGSQTYILEGLEVISGKYSTSYNMGDVAILNYNRQEVQTSATLIPKSQMLNTSMLTGGGAVWASPLYHYKTRNAAQELGGGNQYKSFAYLNGDGKNYLLINDVEENDERIQKGKVTNIKGLGECDGFSFETNGDNVLPKRKFVFGTPLEKKTHNLALFTISDFNRETNVYATLKLEVDGRDRKVKVVWMKID